MAQRRPSQYFQDGDRATDPPQERHSLGVFLSRKRRRGDPPPAVGHVEQPSLTEMEKQVVALKRQYPDMLLLFECGYRMRMFGDDAERASAVLGVRAQRHRAFVEASVPVHRALHHGRRLVLAGFKIGIVKQLGAVPSGPRQPLERDVVEVYTRATIPDALDADDSRDADAADSSGGHSCGQDTATEAKPSLGQSRFILALVEETIEAKRLFTQLVHTMEPGVRAVADFESVSIGVFGYDIHSGEAVFNEFRDDGKRSLLHEFLSLLQPVEFLLPIGNVSPPTEQTIERYSRQEDQIHRDETSSQRLRLEYVEFVDTLSSSDSSRKHLKSSKLPRLAHCCLGAMVTYLRSLRFDITLSIDTIRVSHQHVRFRQGGNRLRLTTSTQRDLSLVTDRTTRHFGDGEGSLFSMMNHTVTAFGARLLKEWLQFPLTSVREIEDRQDCVESMSCVSGDGASIYEALRDDILPSALPIERLLMQLHLRRATTSSVVRLLRALIQAEHQISHALDTTNSIPVLHKLLRLYPRDIIKLETFLQNFDVDAALKNDTEQAISKMWDKFVHEKRQLEDILAKLYAIDKKFHENLFSYRRELKMPTLEYTSHRPNGIGKASNHLFVVEREYLSCIPGDWLVVSSTKSVVRYYAPLVRALQLEEDVLVEEKLSLIRRVWLKIVAAIDAEIYVMGIRGLDVIAQLDCLTSMATVVRLLPNYSRPQFVTTSKLCITGGRHPTLELLAPQGTSYISSDMRLDNEITRGAVTIISGPNMGGKSTLLRMAALLVVMAQVGSFVPATSMTLSTFDTIHSRMHRSPDPKNAGWHHAGIDELHQLAELTKTTTPRSLVILDEVGFGLTTQQANVLAVNIVAYLVMKLRCQVLLATHTVDIVQRIFEKGLSPHQLRTKEFTHEVVNLQEKDPTKMQSRGVVYHYTTRDGVARNSLAFEAASVTGLPQNILKKASRARKHLQHQKHS